MPDVMERDEIVDIPPERVKFFGTTGKMLLPCPATLARVIEQVPAAQVITTDLLRQRLSDQFGVEGTCPITTQRSLQALANDADSRAAYWRVVNGNGGLIARYPGGVAGHADHLRAEGVPVNMSGKPPKVENFKQRLVQFGS